MSAYSRWTERWHAVSMVHNFEFYGLVFDWNLIRLGFFFAFALLILCGFHLSHAHTNTISRWKLHLLCFFGALDIKDTRSCDKCSVITNVEMTDFFFHFFRLREFKSINFWNGCSFLLLQVHKNEIRNGPHFNWKWINGFGFIEMPVNWIESIVKRSITFSSDFWNIFMDFYNLHFCCCCCCLNVDEYGSLTGIYCQNIVEIKLRIQSNIYFRKMIIRQLPTNFLDQRNETAHSIGEIESKFSFFLSLSNKYESSR